MWLMQQFIAKDLWFKSCTYFIIITFFYIYAGWICPVITRSYNLLLKNTQKLPSRRKWGYLPNGSMLQVFAFCLLQLCFCSKGLAISGSTQLFKHVWLPVLFLHTNAQRHRLVVGSLFASKAFSVAQQGIQACSKSWTKLSKAQQITKLQKTVQMYKLCKCFTTNTSKSIFKFHCFTFWNLKKKPVGDHKVGAFVKRMWFKLLSI